MSQEQARQLRILTHAWLDQVGGDGVLIDEGDNPSACRPAPVGDNLVLAEFAADPGISRFRQMDLFMVESGAHGSKLDPRHRLAWTRYRCPSRTARWRLGFR